MHYNTIVASAPRSPLVIANPPRMAGFCLPRTSHAFSREYTIIFAVSNCPRAGNFQCLQLGDYALDTPPPQDWRKSILGWGAFIPQCP